MEVSDEELAKAGATFHAPRRTTCAYAWEGRLIDRPELEAVLLARRLSGRIVMEDDAGIKSARAVGVVVMGVAEILDEMERAGHFSDADVRARAILATGYHSQKLEWLSRRAWPTRRRVP